MDPSKRHRKQSHAWLRANGYASDDSVAVIEPEASSFQDSSGSPAASSPASTQPSTPAPTARKPTTALTTRTSMPAPSISVEESASTAQGRRAILDKQFQNVSDEDALKQQMATWKSTIYKHFKMPPEIVRNAHRVVQYIYHCKQCPSVQITHAQHDDSTSNLQCHAKECRPQDTTETRALTAYAQGSKYMKAKHRLKIALWIACRNCPFTIVEDLELLDIFANLNSRCITPKRRTVSRDLIEIYNVSHQNVALILQKFIGKLHICADRWTSPQVISFIGITVHWIEDGKMVSMVLDFVKAMKSHMGIYLANRLADCLRSYSIQDKILAITLDNASNNDTLMKELSVVLPNFKGPESRVHCFAHILNLVVKAILSQFSKADVDEDDAMEQEILELESGEVGDEEPEVEDEDSDKLTPDVAASDASAVGDIISEVELSNRLSRDSHLGCMSIAKLQSLAKKIVNSGMICTDLASACKTANITSKMVRNVSTRWNSTSELIQPAVELKDALNILVIMTEHNKSRGICLRRFKLSHMEWALLMKLSPLLEVFLYATKKISESNTPLLHNVIPMIDVITTALDEFIDNAALQPVIRHAALQ